MSAEELLPGLAGAADSRVAAGGGTALFLTELMLCIVIIGAVAYLALDEYSDRIRAARLYEPLVNVSSYRNLWVEEHAHSGLPPADSNAYDRRPSGAEARLASSGPEALGSVSGLEALRARAAQGADADLSPAASNERAGTKNAVLGISDGVPMAVVRLRHVEQPLVFELRPAMQSPDGPVVRWLCDSGPAPAGWTAPAARGPRIPDDLLPSACRKGWKP